MYQPSTSTLTPATVSDERPDEGNTRLRGRWLVLIRIICIVLVAYTLGFFGTGLVLAFVQHLTICTGLTCALPISEALVYFAVASVIFWRKPDDWMALFVALMLVLLAPISTLPDAILNLLASVPVLQVLLDVSIYLAFASFLLFWFLFPTGRFWSRWTAWLVVGYLLYLAWAFIEPSEPRALWFLLFILLITNLLIIVVFVQVIRYQNASTPVERQQTKWAIVGTSIAVWAAFVSVFFDVNWTPTTRAILLLVPLSIGIAVLRYRLYDIDVLINRTLVYGMLTLSVVGLYVLIVVASGILFQAQGNLVLSLIATGIIAVLFQPLRTRLQRGVNRLMYGERDEPYRVISRLGQRLEGTLAPEAVLPTICETVAHALKLPYVAITLKRDDDFHLVASAGMSTETTLILPLVYQAETLGQLLLAPRTGSESFTPADHQLLNDLARQAGVAAHAVRLTADLQRSREQLVTAREEERRRLRRDLHDGLGPQLASQTLTLTAARKLLRDDPDAAEKLLTDATAHAQEAITDIRRLVYALRPPVLDDLGLVAAIGEEVDQYRASGIKFNLDAPEHLPPLAAAVEVACYRIIQEALTNVVRHAQARTCTIRLTIGELLTLEITDDGIGLPPTYKVGVGLNSMRERAEELGGTCIIKPFSGGGTRVFAQLPLSSCNTS